MFRHLLPRSLVQTAAFFWGISCFLPVGMSYLAAIMLMAALLLSCVRERDEAGQRWQQVRRHPAFWPLCIFAAWTLFILCVQPHYAETPSNLFHGARIVLTILIVMLLRKPEVLVALSGLVIGAVIALAIIYLHRVVPLPMVPGLRNLLDMRQGNKSIGIAVLLAIFAVCSFLYALKHFGQSSAARLAFAPLFLVIPVLIWFLPSRTSLVLVALCLALGLIHLYWKKPVWLITGVAALILSGLTVSQIPEFKNLFARGTSELRSSVSATHDVNATPLETSWAIRHTLYTQTAEMIIEKPLLGWGIGAWNDQWRARTHPRIHYVNMPHNDFLWAGSQAGILGMLSLAGVVLSMYVGIARRRSFTATCSIVASSGLLIAMSFNSALRDAQIGLSLLFAVVAINAWARADR